MGKQSSAAIHIAVVCAVMAIPPLYVLSFGPAVWLNDHGYVNQETVERAYYPLLRACRATPLLHAWVGTYVRLFRGP